MLDQPPIPAATLVVVREQANGPPELLMVERSKAMAFAGGALVFPGGRIDDGDRAMASDYPGGHSAAAAVAAIRETLEETAIAVGIFPIPSAELCRELQGALLAGRDFGELLRERKLHLDIKALTPFARWVPKFHAVRRFDTLFLVARAPETAEPRVCGAECAGAFWISAADALERERQGEARLIFPTRRNLERLALHDSWDSIQAHALAHPVEPITPWAETISGEEYILIPEGLGYPVTREKLDGLWRG